jgi:Nitrile hydratase, alpha chain
MPEQTSRREFELQLIEKAWKEDAFRQALRSDPKGAVERALGAKLPAGVQVKVVEETADTFYLVLPAKLDRAPAGQLTDQQLGAIAGGGWTEIGNGCNSGGITCDGNTCYGVGCVTNVTCAGKGGC